MNTVLFTITISKHDRQLVHVDNFSLEENKITLLFGESGIGKSLIAKTIYGLLNPEEFIITVDGKSYERYIAQVQAKEIQRHGFFVFQEPSSHLNPLMTLDSQVTENIPISTVHLSSILQRLWDTSDYRRIQRILRVFPKPYRPSGGEKQRLLLAMAFLKIDLLQNNGMKDVNPFFVFDEPSGSLDNHFRDIFLSFLFEKFQQKKFTTLLITHDYSMISAVRMLAPKLERDISYKELTLKQKKLFLLDFKPDYYLNWLKNQEQSRTITRKSSINQPLLRVESGIEVFGRKLSISKERTGENLCPLEILPYSLMYLKAPSGVGKTTFAKSIMGLVKTHYLRLTVKNVILNEITQKKYWQKYIWGKQMAMSFQHADESLNQNSTVKGSLSGLPIRTTPIVIRKAMEELFDTDINDQFLRTKVKYLSGGQKQKLNLLRSFILDTDLLILDEPLNGLDFDSIMKVLSILKKKQEMGKGILLISHNEEIFDAITPKEHIYYLHAQSVI